MQGRSSDLRKFMSMPGPQKLGLLRVIVLLLVARSGTRWLGYRRMKWVLMPMRRPAPKNLQEQEVLIRSSVRLINLARTRVVKEVNCLPTSLVLQSLLRAQGVTTDIRIGVRKTFDGQLEAHAWLETGGRAIEVKNMDDGADFEPFPAGSF
jgi:hypothetical protein